MTKGRSKTCNCGKSIEKQVSKCYKCIKKELYGGLQSLDTI